METVISPPVQVRRLVKSFSGRQALDDLDLTLEAGRIVGLLGENGSGKTTLLKILAGVTSDYEGDVTIAGHRPGPESKAVVSFLPDASYLPNRARATQCIAMFQDFYANFNAEKAHDMLRFFGIDANQRLNAMSKGMREKVQIALAMARDADVYLFDEPISGVDPSARQTIIDGIITNLPEESLMLIATHLVYDLEPIIDSVVMMRGGRTILTGDLDDLRAQHGLSLDQLFKEMYR